MLFEAEDLDFVVLKLKTSVSHFLAHSKTYVTMMQCSVGINI